jgi:hypothetical protein
MAAARTARKASSSLGEETVRTHLKKVQRKLGVRNRTTTDLSSPFRNGSFLKKFDLASKLVPHRAVLRIPRTCQALIGAVTAPIGGAL